MAERDEVRGLWRKLASLWAVWLLVAVAYGVARDVTRESDDLVLRVNLDEGGETYSVVVESSRRFDLQEVCGEAVAGTFGGGVSSFSLVVECGEGKEE